MRKVDEEFVVDNSPKVRGRSRLISVEKISESEYRL